MVFFPLIRLTANRRCSDVISSLVGSSNANVRTASNFNGLLRRSETTANYLLVGFESNWRLSKRI